MLTCLLCCACTSVKGLPIILSLGGRDRKVSGVYLPANLADLVSFRFGENVFSLKNKVEINQDRHDIDL